MKRRVREKKRKHSVYNTLRTEFAAHVQSDESARFACMHADVDVLMARRWWCFSRACVRSACVRRQRKQIKCYYAFKDAKAAATAESVDVDLSLSLSLSRADSKKNDDDGLETVILLLCAVYENCRHSPRCVADRTPSLLVYHLHIDIRRVPTMPTIETPPQK